MSFLQKFGIGIGLAILIDATIAPACWCRRRRVLGTAAGLIGFLAADVRAVALSET